MQKFLSLVWYKVLPPQYGGQKGVALFNKYFGKKKYLTCLCSSDNQTDNVLPYAVYPLLPVSKKQFFSFGIRKRILDFIRRHQFTHIILEHPYHAWLTRYREKFNFKLIVHAHNIEFIRMKKRRKWWWLWVRFVEAKAFKHADFILFKTENDKQKAIQFFDVSENKCFVLPYGTELNSLPVSRKENRKKIETIHNIKPGEIIILFAASLDYEPNKKALFTIFTKIISRLIGRADFPFKLVICGKFDEKEFQKIALHPSLIFAGFVDSIEAYMQAADIFINPVVFGSGIQTKNIEALANGASVASTEYAAEGLPGYLSGKKLLTSKNDDWVQFVENIIVLAKNPCPTPQQFYDDFYWVNIIDRLLAKIL
ncbi:MAG TPA: glycosyltransferase family 4 protein [Chitinophagaceae bacterium]|nr:glycosyltransferase family 4 protein [Chitinophagaceae bacterium]